MSIRRLPRRQLTEKLLRLLPLPPPLLRLALFHFGQKMSLCYLLAKTGGRELHVQTKGRTIFMNSKSCSSSSQMENLHTYHHPLQIIVQVF